MNSSISCYSRNSRACVAMLLRSNIMNHVTGRIDDVNSSISCYSRDSRACVAMLLRSNMNHVTGRIHNVSIAPNMAVFSL